MEKRQSIQEAYQRGNVTAEIRDGASAYLARHPTAPVSLAVSFAKLQTTTAPASNLSAEDIAFIGSVW